jgi:hypothetical protein
MPLLYGAVERVPDLQREVLHSAKRAGQPHTRRPAAAIRADEETAYRCLAQEIVASYSSE